MLSAFDTAVLMKQVVFGLISLTIGLLLGIGLFVDLRRAIHIGTSGRKRRLYLATALLKIGAVIVMVEPLLQILGLPDLPVIDWHVMLLIVGTVMASLGAIGILVETDEFSSRSFLGRRGEAGDGAGAGGGGGVPFTKEEGP